MKFMGFFNRIGIIILFFKKKSTSRLELILYQKSNFCGNRRHHRCTVFKSQGCFPFCLNSSSCTVWIVIPWHSCCNHKYFKGYGECTSNRINRDGLHLFIALSSSAMVLVRLNNTEVTRRNSIEVTRSYKLT